MIEVVIIATFTKCCRKTGAPALQSTLGIERADSFCTGVGAPNVPPPVVLSAGSPKHGVTSASDAKAPEERARSGRPAIEFSSLAQFGPRVELYRGRCHTTPDLMPPAG